MFRLRALLWQRALLKFQLDSSAPCLHSINVLLGACGSLTSPAQWRRRQQQQQYCSSSSTNEDGENLVRQPRGTVKSAVPGWPVGEFERGPRTISPVPQGRQGTRAPKRPQSSEGRSAARPSCAVYVPVGELKAKETCEAVWDMLRNIPPQQIHGITLSAALDHMVAISKRPGYQQMQDGMSAVEQLLHVAEGRLGSMNSWTMAALIRCAAGFKGALQPAGLSAWQRELWQRPGQVEQLTALEVATTLLALGTLAESARQLACVPDVQLAGKLLQHAVGLARASSDHAALSARDAANVLYGAALLGLQPDRAQVAALFSATQRDNERLEKESVAQVLLASQKFIVKAEGMRQEQGLEARRPELDPYNMYYPGDKLMGLMLERAGDLIQQQQLHPRQASQILGACGSLGYLPSHVALEQLLAVGGTGKLNSMDASTTLVGCTRLGIMPPAEVVEACWLAFTRDGAPDTQTIANLAWALALLEACTPRMWEMLTTTLRDNLNTAAQVALRQWHQAYLLMKLEHPHGLCCPPDLFERSLAAHKAELARRAPLTYFERVLAKAVQRLAPGQTFWVEYLVPDPDQDPSGQGWVKVDVALPGLNLAVEADGPLHFLRNVEPPQQTGSTKARDRLLRGWGWHVIVVPGSVWNFGHGASHEEVVAGLVRHLVEHTPFMQCIRST